MGDLFVCRGLGDKGFDAGGVGGVEVGGGFVEEEDLGVSGEEADEAEALAFAGGEAGDFPVGDVGFEVEGGEEIGAVAEEVFADGGAPPDGVGGGGGRRGGWPPVERGMAVGLGVVEEDAAAVGVEVGRWRGRKRDLPEPEGPERPMVSPGATVRSMGDQSRKERDSMVRVGMGCQIVFLTSSEHN